MYEVRRGDVCLIDLGAPQGCIQGGLRPAIVVQNDIGNQYSPTVLVAPVTSQLRKANIPTHVFLPHGSGGLKSDSLVLLEQIQTINKNQIVRTIGALDQKQIIHIDNAIKVSLAL